MPYLFSTILIALSIVSTVNAQIEFATIPGNNDIPDFEMSVTEVTNEQYTKFLNEAYAQDLIIYDAATKMVNNLDGISMIALGGTRVVKDHNNDGVYVLDEMENPLNRCFIQFNSAADSFEIVDPASVDWEVYFDTSIYPNVVDSISDWAELNDAGTGFYGEGDTDKLLPTLEEVKTWSVNFIRYYGAEGFAKFYGYDLPTKTQWRYAGQGGSDFEYATSNGTADENIAWINIDGPGQRHRGHVQPALSKDPNPYGTYHLGGNLWEWCKDWYDGTTVFGGPPKVDEDFFIDDDITYQQSVGNYLKCLLGGSFNFFPATMGVYWNHAALPLAGNDHFGFRVVKNDITNATGDIRLEEEFHIFPNPTNNYVNIKLSSLKTTEVRIYSGLGQVVYSNMISGSERIDVSNWNKGLYIVNIGNVVHKLVIN